MERPYSEKFLLSLIKADPSQVGVQLGRLCIEAEIPATYIAKALDVTRMTVYSWFRGQDIRKTKRKEVEALIGLMRGDFANGRLPVKNRFEAKAYIEEMSGIKL
jgi:hypothetical protein